MESPSGLSILHGVSPTVVIARRNREWPLFLGIEVLIQLVLGDPGVDTLGGYVELGGPEDCVHDQPSEIRVAPVLVRVGAGEAEAAAAVGTLDRPGDDLVAALRLHDVPPRPPRRRRRTLASLVVGLGD